ncbi:SRPBCC family protein [Arthrobacter sp. KBS0702]|uniref:SRPBCC family protein n=1 Tax=Arthrobacter sp. KBS0702 TaxID=2578107 RepID=UPI001C939AA4|nr:SRPBCC family protein [Arthrobacter sp. KBS0702]
MRTGRNGGAAPRVQPQPGWKGPLAALGAAAAAAGYVLAVRPRLLNWGATAQEAAGPLAGDELVPAPRLQSTRAVSIAAPPSAVWPWLVQLGAGRGGMYSYDALENAAGLGMHSADRIIPEFQQLAVGDLIPLSPSGGIPVRRLEPERVLALGGTMDPRTGQVAGDGAGIGRRVAGPRLAIGWTFVLQPLGARSTRLLARTRYDYSPLVLGIPLRGLLEPLQFLMERRMLLGIRARVERRRPRSRRRRGR